MEATYHLIQGRKEITALVLRVLKTARAVHKIEYDAIYTESLTISTILQVYGN